MLVENGVSVRVELVVDSKVVIEFAKLRKKDRKCFLKLQTEHTYNNPEYWAKRNQGYFVKDIPKILRSYTMTKKNISFARGSISKVKKILRKHGHKVRIVDCRLQFPAVDFGSTIKLYEDQVDPVKAIIKKQQGILRGPCSSGKTVMLLAAIAKAKQPATVILWSKDLQGQWKQEILKFFSNISANEIGGCGGIFKKPKVGPINICMQQSLNNAEIREMFTTRTGFCAGDEVQRYGAATYFTSVDDFPAKFRIGGSANERRKDGKHFLIYDAFGKVLVDIPEDEVEARIAARVSLIPTKFRSENFQETGRHDVLIDDQVNDDDRNKLIIKTVIKRSLKKKRIVLILTERKAHALFFYFYFRKNYRAHLLMGHTSKKEIAKSGWPKKWQKYVTDYKSEAMFDYLKDIAERKELDIICATQKGDVGLSVRTLNDVYICGPSGVNLPRFNQQKGRPEREHGELEELYGVKDQPQAFYFWDSKIEKCQNAGNNIMKKYPDSRILKTKKH